MSDSDIAARYDLRGLKCPLPVLKTRKRMVSLEPGALVWVETTDPLAVVDIPHFCSEDGHRLVETRTVDGGHHFLIEKRR
ncbi:sulfurtransferase TusA family protein [Hoeflea poritis]|uniref:Sulfurtransferase TusA family protein n=1 Tax=Hoeflea poritis TaxID=2993659 RepID=A0ABT4VLY4_9HYPH|nr:sulfurtransferase TusA family protein [Hoeflea poritis]MDA4845665.1 sulfurtransferase TusA family protein [Hoeflea poritis]